ncbi:hypothetical protein XFEB_00147 [Xylella fastidiosa EB92.1]|nr:hypothetical protein XFEB_00147 [Xylella fastidiosa EB92.1]
MSLICPVKVGSLLSGYVISSGLKVSCLERWACIVCLRVNHTRRQINDELLSASNADKESDLHDHASKRESA